jgi:predicted Holliday junction resolvase-like endonuclease
MWYFGANHLGARQMNSNGLMVELTRFFKTARHLWGRCPRCGDLFRLSEAAISFGNEAPADWLRRLQRQQLESHTKQDVLHDWQATLDRREIDVEARERELLGRERSLVKEARQLARDLVKDDKTFKTMLTEERRKAVVRSRATLLGHLFERLAPFFQRFNHDPRDVRPLMNPVDYVVFDGLTVNRRVERIVFVEVKSGTSRESTAQKSIADAVRNGRIAFETWQIGKRGIPLEQQLLGHPQSERPVLPPPLRSRAVTAGSND